MHANPDNPPSPEEAPRFFDMSALITRLRSFVDARAEQAVALPVEADRAALLQRFDFRPRRQGSPEVVLAANTQVELGHPATASCTLLLLTHDPAQVVSGRVTRIGPDLDALDPDARHAFAQVVMLAADPDASLDPFELDSAQYLFNRLPGYMVRSVPGRLWVRISRRGFEAGLRLTTVGAALIDTYLTEFEGVQACEVLFVTASDADVEALLPLHTEAEILAGKHKKLALGLDGEVECRELDCDTCEEKPVCDTLRDVVIKRRRQTHA